MPGKWQFLNGSRYPAEGFEDDYASPRSTEEKTHISSVRSRCLSPSATPTDNLRKRVSQVPRDMRTRNGTDYRKLLIQKNVEEPIEKDEPIYEQRSMIDRWMDGAEFLEEPEVESIEESTEEPEEFQCHPTGWTKKNHYSELGWQWCGQSCPCCRAHAGDTLGACPVCIRERK